jgi:hypothetical protein
MKNKQGVPGITLFPKTYDRFCRLIDRGRPYLLESKVEQYWGAAALTVDHVRQLSV